MEATTLLFVVTGLGNFPEVRGAEGETRKRFGNRPVAIQALASIAKSADIVSLGTEGADPNNMWIPSTSVG